MSLTLAEKRILITRSRAQASPLSRLLEQKGATILEIPTIQIQVRPEEELDQAVRRIPSVDWLIFTSPNGAEIFLARARRADSPAGNIPAAQWPRIATIGPATRSVVERFGLSVDLVPRRYRAEDLAEALAEVHAEGLGGLRFLLPRASRAREVLPRELKRLGAEVLVIPIYDTALPEDSRESLRRVLSDEPPDLVTFTSSSTVYHFVELAGRETDVGRLRCAAIGPVTAETARECGFEVVAEAEEYTLTGLVAAIEDYFAAR